MELRSEGERLQGGQDARVPRSIKAGAPDPAKAEDAERARVEHRLSTPFGPSLLRHGVRAHCNVKSVTAKIRLARNNEGKTRERIVGAAVWRLMITREQEVIT